MQLTVRDVAEIFSVPENRVYRWISDESLPSLQIDGQHFFNNDDLLEWATVRRLKFSPELLSRKGPGRASSSTSNGGANLVQALELGGDVVRISGTDRRTVLARMVESMSLPPGTDREMLLNLFQARESRGSTAVGDGIAIPHPQHPVILPVAKPVLALCFLETPVDFQAPDGQPIHTLFTLICPTIRSHLAMLARVAVALRDDGFRSAIRRRLSHAEIVVEARRVESEFATKPRETA
jgi:PTS system nitrogen regulatory IIA component